MVLRKVIPSKDSTLVTNTPNSTLYTPNPSFTPAALHVEHELTAQLRRVAGWVCFCALGL